MGHDDWTQRTTTATNKRTEAFCIKTKNVIIKKKKKNYFQSVCANNETILYTM